MVGQEGQIVHGKETEVLVEGGEGQEEGIGKDKGQIMDVEITKLLYLNRSFYDAFMNASVGMCLLLEAIADNRTFNRKWS